MRSVGLKVLKNKLSEYVRLAAGGETVLVTDRDRVVAELGPPRPERGGLLADAPPPAAGRARVPPAPGVRTRGAADRARPRIVSRRSRPAPRGARRHRRAASERARAG